MTKVSSTHVFRPKRLHRDIAIVTIVSFALFGGICVPILLQDEQGRIAAWWLGLESAACVCLGGYSLRYYHRAGITIAGNTLTCQGVFRRRSCRIEDVTSVVWRTWPVGGSAVIRSPTTRVVIDFGNFRMENACELAEWVRNSFPHAIQEQLPKYEYLHRCWQPTREPILSFAGHWTIIAILSLGVVVLTYGAMFHNEMPYRLGVAAAMFACAAVITLAHFRFQIVHGAFKQPPRP